MLTTTRTNRQLAILLVGTGTVILRAMQQWLAPLGHSLSWVPNSREALRELQLHPFDMVVTESGEIGLEQTLMAQYLRHSGSRASLVGLRPEHAKGEAGHPMYPASRR